MPRRRKKSRPDSPQMLCTSRWTSLILRMPPGGQPGARLWTLLCIKKLLPDPLAQGLATHYKSVCHRKRRPRSGGSEGNLKTTSVALDAKHFGNGAAPPGNGKQSTGNAVRRTRAPGVVHSGNRTDRLQERQVRRDVRRLGNQSGHGASGSGNRIASQSSYFGRPGWGKAEASTRVFGFGVRVLATHGRRAIDLG